ncbi:MAG: GNAT family N-acetyltransferase, partial [Eubacterium sp.]
MIKFKENKLDVDTYLALRKEAHWKDLTKEQAQKALDRSLYTIVAYEDEKPCGMGRIIGDGAVICYIQDIIISPASQKRGLGREIMQRLIDF